MLYEFGGRVFNPLIVFTLRMEIIRSSETSVPTRTTQKYISANDILQSHRRENLKSYIALAGWAP
jgi:hypothetical protein